MLCQIVGDCLDDLPCLMLELGIGFRSWVALRIVDCVLSDVGARTVAREVLFQLACVVMEFSEVCLTTPSYSSLVQKLATPWT